MINRISAVLVFLLSAVVVADDSAPSLWQRIGFTATEVLIYTDQLQKLDATICNQTPVSAYSTDATRVELLQLMPAAERERLAVLLDSPMIQGLLEENSNGIASMLGAQSLTGGAPSDKVRATCLELELTFADNQRQARAELEQLIGEYRNP